MLSVETQRELVEAVSMVAAVADKIDNLPIDADDLLDEAIAEETLAKNRCRWVLAKARAEMGASNG